MNLLANAIDALQERFTTSSNELPAILINSEIADGEWAVIPIIDNGYAIPKEIYSKRFEPIFMFVNIGKKTVI